MGIVDSRQSESLDNELEELDTSTPDVPEKYKGKSIEDVIKMHEEAERKASRLADEVGQLRTLQPREQRKEPEKKEVKVDDLLENPEQAVNTLVNQNPVIKKVDELEQSIHRRNFEDKYPEYRSDIKDEKFIEWIKANPLRITLANAADNADFAAADALWQMWDERKQVLKEVETSKAKQKDDKRKADLKKGTLESGNGQPTESNKVWSRAEIRAIKERAMLGDRTAQATVADPAWQAQVWNAYAEGRAK